MSWRSLPYLRGPSSVSLNPATIASSAVASLSTSLPIAATDADQAQSAAASSAALANSAAAATAAAEALIMAWQTEATGLFAYLVANPGAMLFASLPSGFPATSGQIYIDGGLAGPPGAPGVSGAIISRS